MRTADNKLETTYPFGDQPAESVYLLLSPSVPRERLLRWLDATLPTLNWRSHVFALRGRDEIARDARSHCRERTRHPRRTGSTTAVPEPLAPRPRTPRTISSQPLSREGSIDIASAIEIANFAADFVRRNGLATLTLHPVLEWAAVSDPPWDAWRELLDVGSSFQEEAYEKQTEARFLIAPIIIPSGIESQVESAELTDVAAFFHDRFATPSFYLGDGAPHEFDHDVRQFLEAGSESVVGMVEQLWMNHVFESTLDRIEDPNEALLSPCRRHWVVDEGRTFIYPCFNMWESEDTALHLGKKVFVETHEGAPKERCAECIARSMKPMGRNLEANGRKTEGRQVCSALTRALTDRGEHRLAGDMAHCAFELSDTNDERAAALIQEGLCRLAQGDLQAAEDTLASAPEFGADDGFVAYHRGRVQFVWRDYIEALDRFEEALASSSAQVPREDMCFQMALSHINLEEYADARPYLEQSLEAGAESAPVSFYRGVCDYGDGDSEAALVHFEDALRIGPSEDDLGRVLFYVGSCHKEMERFDEAIDALRRAIDADPGDLPNYNLLGFCYYKVQRHEEAVSCFRKAVELDPRSGIDWANLGSNLRDLGRIDEAVAMYEKALSIDPTIGFAAINLAKLREVM